MRSKSAPSALSVVPIVLFAGVGCQALDVGSTSRAVETDCGLYEGAILSHSGATMGSTMLSDDGESLHVELAAGMVGGYDFRFQQVAVYAGTSPIVASAGDILHVGGMPYQASFGDGHDIATYPSAHSLSIPLDAIGHVPGTCTDLNVAIYVRMKRLRAADGLFLDAPQGWVAGDQTFKVGYGVDKVGTGFSYTVCCDADEPPADEPPADEPPADEPPADEPITGCTLTQGYWKNHNEYARGKSQKIDWPAPHDELDRLCGETLLGIFKTAPKGSGWLILAHQYIASMLNVATGASTPAEVAAALSSAADLLVATCTAMSAEERQNAVGLAELLDDYNNGRVGPGHCDDGPMTSVAID